MIKFTIDGEPTAAGRPRFTSQNGHNRAYDPKESRDYKSYVRMVASLNKPNEPLTDALWLQVNIYRKMPKSFSKIKQQQAERRILRPTTKPDSSNYLKLLEDACNGIIWKDDSQLCDVIVKKYYSARPRVEIEVGKIQ